jgi:hypothetical protein
MGAPKRSLERPHKNVLKVMVTAVPVLSRTVPPLIQATDLDQSLAIVGIFQVAL